MGSNSEFGKMLDHYINNIKKNSPNLSSFNDDFITKVNDKFGKKLSYYNQHVNEMRDGVNDRFEQFKKEHSTKEVELKDIGQYMEHYTISYKFISSDKQGLMYEYDVSFLNKIIKKDKDRFTKKPTYPYISGIKIILTPNVEQPIVDIDKGILYLKEHTIPFIINEDDFLLENTQEYIYQKVYSTEKLNIRYKIDISALLNHIYDSLNKSHGFNDDAIDDIKLCVVGAMGKLESQYITTNMDLIGLVEDDYESNELPDSLSNYL